MLSQQNHLACFLFLCCFVYFCKATLRLSQSWCYTGGLAAQLQWWELTLQVPLKSDISKAEIVILHIVFCFSPVARILSFQKELHCLFCSLREKISARIYIIFLIFILIIHMCVCCVCLSVGMCTHVQVSRDQRYGIPQELELQTVVSSPVCILGTELGPISNKGWN